MPHRGVWLCAALLLLLTVATPGRATTKGLNQIVTPDILAPGRLGLSIQAQHPIIGDSLELQAEMGVTKQFELAYYRGLRPGDNILHTELGLVQKGHALLSTGFLNWSTRGSAPQPFLEAGYYTGPVQTMAGVIRVGGQWLAMLGLSYAASPKLALQLDYQSGDNFATAGFTWNITPSLQFNPAVYIANSSPHSTYGYAVLTWNVSLWPTAKKGGAQGQSQNRD